MAMTLPESPLLPKLQTESNVCLKYLGRLMMGSSNEFKELCLLLQQKILPLCSQLLSH